MRVSIRSTWGDRYGTEIGYVTDVPTFDYHVAEEAPKREAIVEALNSVAARETRPAYGGAADENAICGGYGTAPATDADRLSMAVKVLSGRTYPVRLVREDEDD